MELTLEVTGRLENLFSAYKYLKPVGSCITSKQKEAKGHDYEKKKFDSKLEI